MGEENSGESINIEDGLEFLEGKNAGAIAMTLNLPYVEPI